MKCWKCGRPISSADSLASGLGPTCREHRSAIDQKELFDGLPRETERKREVIVDFDALTGRTK